MDEISAALEESPLVQGHVSGDLLHPGFIRMVRDPGDLNASAVEKDKEQHVVGDQPTQCQYLHRKKVSARKNRPMGADEIGPRGRSFALRRRRNAVALQNITHCFDA